MAIINYIVAYQLQLMLYTNHKQASKTKNNETKHNKMKKTQRLITWDLMIMSCAATGS